MNNTEVAYQPYQHPHSYAHPVFAQQASIDGLAIASFVCALLGLNLVAVILGHVSLGRIRRRGLRGSALAIVGIVLGYLTLAAIILIAVVVTISVVAAVNA